MKLKKVLSFFLLFVLLVGNSFVFADEDLEVLEYSFVFDATLEAVSVSYEEPEIYSRSAVILDRASRRDNLG
ncbi:MAG: hypothetical protein FWC68_02835 [Oscillospiraceae bacterium]|nr:hypothetical protein [Oscillospiraceae bacterium]